MTVKVKLRFKSTLLTLCIKMRSNDSSRRLRICRIRAESQTPTTSSLTMIHRTKTQLYHQREVTKTLPKSRTHQARTWTLITWNLLYTKNKRRRQHSQEKPKPMSPRRSKPRYLLKRASWTTLLRPSLLGTSAPLSSRNSLTLNSKKSKLSKMSSKLHLSNSVRERQNSRETLGLKWKWHYLNTKTRSSQATGANLKKRRNSWWRKRSRKWIWFCKRTSNLRRK